MKTLAQVDGKTLDTILLRSHKIFTGPQYAAGGYEDYHEISQNICESLGIVDYNPEIIDQRILDNIQDYVDEQGM